MIITINNPSDQVLESGLILEYIKSAKQSRIEFTNWAFSFTNKDELSDYYLNKMLVEKNFGEILFLEFTF